MKKLFLFSALLCFIQGYSQTVISTNTTWNTNFVQLNDVIIQNGATLTIDGASIEMDQNKKIVILSGGKLIGKNGGQLKALRGKVWQGIEIFSSGFQTVHVAIDLDDFEIMRAKEAIRFVPSITAAYYGNGMYPFGFSIKNTVFDKNDLHFAYTAIDGSTISSSNLLCEISNCSFLDATNSWPFLIWCPDNSNIIIENSYFNYYQSTTTGVHRGIHIDRARDVTIRKCTFENIGAMGISLHFQANNVTIENNSFTPNVDIPSGIPGPPSLHDYVGIDMFDEVGGNYFDVKISGNTFYPQNISGPTNAIYCRYTNTQNLNIKNNTFNNFDLALRLQNIASNSYVQENIFENCTTGILAESGNGGLNINCNYFENGTKGIHVQNMPIVQMNTSDFGNDFNNVTTAFQNDDMNQTLNVLESVGPWNNWNTSTTAGNVTMAVTYTSSAVVCAPVNMHGPKKSLEISSEDKAYKVFPNPASNHLSIVGFDYTNTTAKLVDLQGKIVLEQNLGSEELWINHIQPGSYILMIQENNAIVHREQVIIE